MKKIEINLFETFSWLYNDLKKNGIVFNEEGYPLFKSSFYLREKPELIIPFNHRKAAKNKSKTVLCFYMKDLLLYKRVSTLKKDLESLKGYMGICGFDLSPRIGWNENLQKFNILLSQMITVWFALNGIKVIPNLRTGDYSTFSCLKSYEKDLQFSFGALGNWKKKITLEDLYYLNIKLMIARPSSLLIYGKLEEECEEFILNKGIPYTVYSDFRTLCYEKRGA